MFLSLFWGLIRLVHETHAAQTKKNREWQDKLPIVVLKAEEIIYSKANSEVFVLELKLDLFLGICCDIVCFVWLGGLYES